MPSLLRTALRCIRWNCLPEAGGERDQPAGLLDKLGVLINIYESAQAYNQATDKAKWAEGNERLWEIYAWAYQMELDYVRRTSTNSN